MGLLPKLCPERVTEPLLKRLLPLLSPAWPRWHRSPAAPSWLSRALILPWAVPPSMGLLPKLSPERPTEPLLKRLLPLLSPAWPR